MTKSKTAALTNQCGCHLAVIIEMFNGFTDSSSTVKEAKKQRKEAKLIKELDKQREQEAAEKTKLQETQSKKGNKHKRCVMGCCECVAENKEL